MGIWQSQSDKQKDLATMTRSLVLSAVALSNDFFQCARKLGRLIGVEFHDEPTTPSSGTRMTIPRPSLVTSIGPSPVRGFIAAIAHPHPVVIWQLAGSIIPYHLVLPESGSRLGRVRRGFSQPRPAEARSNPPHDRRPGR